MTTEMAKLLVSNLTYGLFSEVWMERQIAAFCQFRPSILTWRFNSDSSLLSVPVKVLDYPLEAESDSFYKRNYYRLLHLPHRNFYRSRGKESQEIVAFLSSEKPDVILCHFGWTGLRLIDIARKQKIPLGVYFHGRDLSVCLRNRWYRWSLRHRLQYFAKVFVVGSHQYQWMKEHGVDPSRLELIPCGVPTNEFTPPVDRIQRDTLQFISVSRLSEEKGHEYALRAFTKVVSVFPQARMIIIGDGPAKDELGRFIQKLNLQGRAELLGQKEPRQILNYLHASDIFVQHSIVDRSGCIEGFGVSIAEASSSGLPLVVTDCGGIADQVVDGLTGYIVPQRDIHVMADKMLKLAKNAALRSKMGQAGRVRMVEKFDATKQTLKLERALLELIK